VCVDEEVVQPELFEIALHPRPVRAFRQPDPYRVDAEARARGLHANAQFGAKQRFGREQRQERVRRRRREHLDPPALRQTGESGDEIAAAGCEIRAKSAIARGVVARELRAAALSCGLCAAGVLIRCCGDARDVCVKTFLQIRICQLFEQDRRDADGRACRNCVALQTFEDAEQRQIRASHGFVQPLLAERPAPGLAHVRQMCVERQHERAEARFGSGRP
jgi:hypothetical protein